MNRGRNARWLAPLGIACLFLLFGYAVDFQRNAVNLNEIGDTQTKKKATTGASPPSLSAEEKLATIREQLGTAKTTTKKEKTATSDDGNQRKNNKNDKYSNEAGSTLFSQENEIKENSVPVLEDSQVLTATPAKPSGSTDTTISPLAINYNNSISTLNLEANPTLETAISGNDNSNGIVNCNQSFPECFVHKSLKVPDMGKYISILNTTDDIVDEHYKPRPPRSYNHTCFILKARYNCEYDHSQKLPKHLASDFKLVLKQSVLPQRRCDLPKLVDFAGGPQGIAQQILLTMNAKSKKEYEINKKTDKETTYTKWKPRTRLNMVFLGNSFMRQMFEAMICRFEHQITNLKVQVGGPGIKLADMEARNQTLFTKQELMELGIRFIGYEEAKAGGCHERVEGFFREGVTVPPTIDGCEDNVAMVELGNVLRVFYVFRPTLYEQDALQWVLEQVGYYKMKGKQRKANKIDVIVNNEKVKDRETFPKSTKEYGFYDTLLMLKKLQRIASPANRYFGANNPGIHNPPDIHPCMPGIPDDEINFLFLRMLQDFVVTVDTV